MAKLGLYEKATPINITWEERLHFTKQLGFDFIEMSIDETDQRLKRLDWSDKEIRQVRNAIDKIGIPIKSMCLSGHRRFPLGSIDLSTQEHALLIMKKAVKLAVKLGIRNIQLAGYDVYYEKKSVTTRENFVRNLKKCVKIASQHQVMLSIEIMDDPFMSSITKYLEIKKQVNSPWLQVYPDIGNLSAWFENDPAYELEQGIASITAIHLKDTKSTKEDGKGVFKNVKFGEGCVDFEGCIKTLKRLDYDGTFLIEMWSENDEKPHEKINEALQFLLPILKKGGYDFE